MELAIRIAKYLVSIGEDFNNWDDKTDEEKTHLLFSIADLLELKDQILTNQHKGE